MTVAAEPFTIAPGSTEEGYRAAVAASAPLRYWVLDEPTGSVTATDLIAGAADHRDPPWFSRTAGPMGSDSLRRKGLRRRPDSGVVEDTQRHLGPGAFTIECWVRAVNASGAVFEFNADRVPGASRSPAITLSALGQLVGMSYPGTTQTITDGYAIVGSAAWHHVALTNSGGFGQYAALTLYRNGIIVATTNTSAPPLEMDGFWHLLQGGANASLGGSLCHAAVYNRALRPGRSSWRSCRRPQRRRPSHRSEAGASVRPGSLWTTVGWSASKARAGSARSLTSDRRPCASRSTTAPTSTAPRTRPSSSATGRSPPTSPPSSAQGPGWTRSPRSSVRSSTPPPARPCTTSWTEVRTLSALSCSEAPPTRCRSSATTSATFSCSGSPPTRGPEGRRSTPLPRGPPRAPRSGSLIHLPWSYPGGSGGAVGARLVSGGGHGLPSRLRLYGPISGAAVTFIPDLTPGDTTKWAQIIFLNSFPISAGQFVSIDSENHTAYLNDDVTQSVLNQIDWNHLRWPDLAPLPNWVGPCNSAG